MKAQVSAINKEKALEKVPSLNIVDTDVHRCHDWKTVDIYLQQQRSAGQDVCGGWADTATLDTGPPHSSLRTRAT